MNSSEPDNADAHLDLASTIAFFAEGKLRKTSVQAGAVVTLCDADIDPWWKLG